MAKQQQDSDLRALFQELRAQDEGDLPDFQEIMEGSEGESPREETSGEIRTRWFPARRPLLWGGSLLAAATASFLLLVDPGGGTSEAEFEAAVLSFSADPAGGAWRSPTEGLLELPLPQLLKTRPRLDGRALSSIPGTGSRPNQI